MPTIPERCAPLAQQLEAARDVAIGLREEFERATGREKSHLFFLLRAAVKEVNRLTAELHLCVHPPPPRPDLVPIDVKPFVHTPADRMFDLATVIENQGAGQAKGPFVVTMGVEYLSFTQDPPLRVFREHQINVPAGVTIDPGATFVTDKMPDIPINRRPGSQLPPKYDIYVLADSNKQVAESAEGNNYLQLLGHTFPGIG